MVKKLICLITLVLVLGLTADVFAYALAGEWELNGNGDDSSGWSGGPRNVSSVGGAGYTAGKYGQGITLNGTSQYFQAAADATWDPYNMTIMAWIKPEASNGYIMSNGGPGGWRLMLVGGQLEYYAMSDPAGGEAGTTDASIATDGSTWYHVCVIHTCASSAKIYIDGVDETDWSGGNVGAGVGGVATDPLCLGAYDDGGGVGGYYSGAIDAARYFRTTITAGGGSELEYFMNLPEPATIALLGLGGLALIRRKR
jgi:hypothetical protein